MRSRRWRLRATLLVGVGVVVTAMAVALTLTDPLRRVELDTIDKRFERRGIQAAPDDVTVVHIDGRSIREIGLRWPFPRGLHADVIDRLRRAGARVIAYDVVFLGRSDDRGEDNALSEAVHRARGRIVLATIEKGDPSDTKVLAWGQTKGPFRPRVGSALVPRKKVDVRRTFQHTVSGIPGFAVVAVETAERRRVSQDGFADGKAWIDYRGPSGSIDGVSFLDILEGKNLAQFRDKVVVVGVSDPAVHDRHSTSVSGDGSMSGAEIQANAISTLLRGVPLRSVPGWVEALLAVLLAVIAPLTAVSMRRSLSAAIVVAAGLAYVVLVQLAFEAGHILPLLYPMIALTLSGFGVILVEFSAKGFEAERIRELFSRFVPESVVSQAIAASDGDLRLDAEQTQSSILFCDLRGFTGFAELRPADEVIGVLNRYLTEMSEAIRAHGGTLLAYQGDGILAAFGAPIEQRDHADRAVDAVREMIGPRLVALNDWLRATGVSDGFEIGIGVNSGIATYGNVGCEWRVEYTAIGDTVNTASRLETMTKTLPHAVLISDTTRAMLLREAPDLRYVDATEIRGKHVKANLWTIDIAPGAGASPDQGPPSATVTKPLTVA